MGEYRKLPGWVNEIVVWDTGAYRDFVRRKESCDQNRQHADEVREKERAKGIQAMASPLVIWELVNHLSDPADEDRDSCLKALCQLAVHCRSGEDRGSALMMVPGPETTMCMTLFSEVPSKYEQYYDELQKMAVHVGNTAPELLGPMEQSIVDTHALNMATKEAGFREGLGRFQEAFRLGIEAKVKVERLSEEDAIKWAKQELASDKWERQFAEMICSTHAEMLGKHLSRNELEGRINHLIMYFSTPWRHFVVMLRKFMEKNSPPIEGRKKKWENFVWDNGLSYLLGENHRYGAVPLRLITGDTEIHDGAEEAGCMSRIQTMPDYVKWLWRP